MARKRLVDGVIDYFVYKMMQTSHRRCADIHTGAFADGLKPLEHLYLTFGVSLVSHNGIQNLVLGIERRLCCFNVKLADAFGAFVFGADCLGLLGICFGSHFLLVLHFVLYILSFVVCRLLTVHTANNADRHGFCLFINPCIRRGGALLLPQSLCEFHSREGRTRNLFRVHPPPPGIT